MSSEHPQVDRQTYFGVYPFRVVVSRKRGWRKDTLWVAPEISVNGYLEPDRQGLGRSWHTEKVRKADSDKRYEELCSLVEKKEGPTPPDARYGAV